MWIKFIKYCDADPTFYTPSPVDILLGADVCASIMKDGMRRGPGGTPTAWNSALGWILIGTVHPTPSVKIHLTEPQLGDALDRFWHQEEIPASSILTPEEKACEEHFAAHHVRINNRYVVDLPFKEDPSVLGSSRYTALRRLYSLERQLLKVPSRYAEYADFLDTCLKLGHMELVPEDEISKPCHYYLPHHAVLKEESTSTKLRVVFSGKDPTSSGKSLNDILMVGPKLQPDLITTIIRFRRNLIAFTADIVKMYRQVQVALRDRDFQRILWRGAPDEPVRDYRLTKVTYGTSSAPYQAVKALQQLSVDFKVEFPIASKVINNSFYVDDLLSGASSIQEATQIYNELTNIMEKGGFELRKWASNNATFLKSVPPEHRGTSSPQIIEEYESIKTLGIKWHPCEDYFSFDVLQYEERGPVTKRIILSDTLKTFDPCGSLAPVTIKAKMFLQKLWKNLCKWDDPLPPETQESWKTFHKELKGLEELKIHRCINLKNSVKYHLHGFCDASEKAFAAAVYLRCEAEDGTVQVRLIASKTKVAPIKPIQLPRLELCSSVLLVRLLAIITPALDSIYIDEIHAWSDSNIALCWIAAHPSRWKTFIANRVTEIQESTGCSWHHVRSEENPADCASRGIAVSELLNHPLWWPPWLQSNSFPLQNIEEPEPEGALLEEKKQPPLVVHVSKEDSILFNFSSLTKLKRVTAYLYRFADNCKKNKEGCLSGPLTVEELNCALLHWVKEVQATHFESELKSLTNNEPLPKRSKLRFLNPFLDSFGILRVGGRIQRAQIPFDKKFPSILPPKSYLTNLILAHEHLTSLHGEAQLMWASISRRFWILNASDVIRQYVRKCIVCFRFRKENAIQMMADLPAARVNRSRVFLNCGVDYAGPFSLRASKLRVNTVSKGWVALFVCFTTRAIHLELVSDASTDTFLAALKRFISRRGICQAIHSDVGTNFKGADNELKRLLNLFRSEDHNKAVAEALSTNEIQWIFNSPASPHMGGLWEAGVKSFKHHLKRVVGTHILTFEEFNTVLCQIESCLNSRPLCPMSTDPSDLSALTPGHFLIGEALQAVPEPDLTILPENRLSRWQLTQKIVQAVWKRWNTELITRLQQRKLWLSPKPNLEVGTLVLLKDENLPPLRWMLARITKLHPGKDGHVRIVTIKTKDSELVRPIVKLCPLPIDAVIP